MFPRKYLLLVAILGLVVSLDQLTKFIVTVHFSEGQSRPLIEGYLNIVEVHNPGAAFGVLAQLSPDLRGPLLFFVPSLVLLLILVFFSRVEEEKRLSIHSLSLIVGGALGNLVDRVRLGYVVDFVDFHWHGHWHFPAFNVADAAICLGVAGLMLSMIYETNES